MLGSTELIHLLTHFTNKDDSSLFFHLGLDSGLSLFPPGWAPWVCWPALTPAWQLFMEHTKVLAPRMLPALLSNHCLHGDVFKPFPKEVSGAS